MKSTRDEGKPLNFTVKERGNSLLLYTSKPGESVEAFIDGTFLFTSTTSKKGEIKINKKIPDWERDAESLGFGQEGRAEDYCVILLKIIFRRLRKNAHFSAQNFLY